MRKTVKDGLVISAIIVAALLFAICSVAWVHTALEASMGLGPWAHMTLEASLNFLWVLLAISGVVHWLRPRQARRCYQLPELVSLVFVLSLLFPVISANDDLAQLDLINDANCSQQITTSLKNDNQLHSTGQLESPATLLIPPACFPPLSSELASEPTHPASVATPGVATGNHSPPRG